MQINPTFHVFLLKKFISGSLIDQESVSPPEFIDMEGQPAYITRSLHRTRKLEYLTDYEVHEPEQQNWVQNEYVLDPLLKKNFHAEN